MGYHFVFTGINNTLVIGHLSFNHCEKLAVLDRVSSHPFEDYFRLAGELGVSRKKREALRLHARGGGDPAREFFSSLLVEHGENTIKNLILNLKEMKRNDIVLYLEKLPNFQTKCLRDLSEEERNKISEELNRTKGKGIQSWDNLASRYGYSVDRIEEIRSVIKEKGSYSPTKALFNLLRQEQPDLPLDRLLISLKNIGSNDVAGYLEKIMDEIRQNNVEEL